MKYYFIDYIIRFKFLKPRLMTLIKQLEKLLKDKKKNLLNSSAILIQYHLRRWLKRLRLKKEKKLKRKGRRKPIWKRSDWRSPNYKNKNQDKEKQKRINENLSSLTRMTSLKRSDKKVLIDVRSGL
mmetsp:Transcript_20735/g.18380  ORF Transcript_20735/g.18380 Transcript_20735/m.18380 type:complete len:126 (+) Transcript_20735:659-1036(+)